MITVQKKCGSITKFTDDMCHLAPYAKKKRTELTKFFTTRKLAVDFLHFKVGEEIKMFLNITIYSFRIT